MGLETWGSGSKPDTLNVNWPAGTDDLKYGDDHLRLIKTTVKNFYIDYGSFTQNAQGRLTALEGKFTGNDAKNAKLLEGRNLAYVLYAGNLQGIIPNAHLNFAGLTQAGITTLSSSVSGSSQAKAATEGAVKVAMDRANAAYSKADQAANQGVRFGPVQTGSTSQISIPANSVMVGMNSRAQQLYRRIL